MEGPAAATKSWSLGRNLVGYPAYSLVFGEHAGVFFPSVRTAVHILGEVDASRRGVIKEMEAAFKKGADPNSKDEHGNTALICAAQRGQAKACELLIQKKAGGDRVFLSGPRRVDWGSWKTILSPGPR